MDCSNSWNNIIALVICYFSSCVVLPSWSPRIITSSINSCNHSIMVSLCALYCYSCSLKVSILYPIHKSWLIWMSMTAYRWLMSTYKILHLAFNNNISRHLCSNNTHVFFISNDDWTFHFYYVLLWNVLTGWKPFPSDVGKIVQLIVAL